VTVAAPLTYPLAGLLGEPPGSTRHFLVSGVTIPLPDWLLRAFPKVTIPTLVLWGMKDPALLPIQLDGMDQMVEDLRIARIPAAGHFAPWEAPDDVAAALSPFLAEHAGATAPAA